MIDFHLHLAGNGCCNSKIILGQKFQKGTVFKALKFLQGITPEQLMTDIDELWLKRICTFLESNEHVSEVVGLCLDMPHTESGEPILENTQLHVPNSWGVHAHTFSRGRILFGASVHPYRKDALEELQKVYAKGAFLIKWLPSMMGIDPASEKCDPFYAALREMKLPLLSHTDREYTFKALGDSWKDKNDVLRLRRPLSQGVTVIAAHAGTPSQMEDLEKLATEFPNLYADSSAIISTTRARSAPALLQRIKNSVLKERILFGTDWPIPPVPLLIADHLGLQKAHQLQFIKNPFERDVAIKAELGLSVEDFKKNQHRLLTSLERLDY
jgi:hypothetical protein